MMATIMRMLLSPAKRLEMVDSFLIVIFIIMGVIVVAIMILSTTNLIQSFIIIGYHHN